MIIKTNILTFKDNERTQTFKGRTDDGCHLKMILDEFSSFLYEICIVIHAQAVLYT